MRTNESRIGLSITGCNQKLPGQIFPLGDKVPHFCIYGKTDEYMRAVQRAVAVFHADIVGKLCWNGVKAFFIKGVIREAVV